MDSVVLDAAGRRRSAATMPGHRRGQVPRSKGVRYPADPRSVEEIVLVMRHAGDRAYGLRLRGLIVVMWRAGLRISEALALTESDLDEARGAILVRHGKGNRRREVGMDQWGDGSCFAAGSPTACRCRSGRCSAASTVAPAGGH
jgi:integrase